MHIIGGPFTKVEFTKYSIDSPDQLKEFLYTLGWKPDEWNYKDGKKTSPKITESSLASIGESLLGRWIIRYLIIRHRRGYLMNIKSPEEKGIFALTREEDGRIEADGFTLGTPTARYRHKNVVNLPACDPKVLYGCEMRAIFRVYDPYILIGSDLSAIEARLLGHFTAFFDGGAMAKELLEGDIHTKNANLIGKSRSIAKIFFYSLLYGVGVTKLAKETLGCSNKEAQKIMDAFYDGNPGLKKLKQFLETYYKKHKYIRGIDGRRLFIRSNHVLLNSLIQGSAAIIFKDWGCRIWDAIDNNNLMSEIIIAMHDEYQIRSHKSEKDIMTKILSDTLKDTKEHFNLKVELATDTVYGMNYADTH